MSFISIKTVILAYDIKCPVELKLAIIFSLNSLASLLHLQQMTPVLVNTFWEEAL